MKKIIIINNVDFGDGDIIFDKTSFGNGTVFFQEANFGCGDVTFLNAKFRKGNVLFFGTSFGKGDVVFDNAEFGIGNVTFDKASFGEGNVSFEGVNFGKGRVSLNGFQAHISDCGKSFQFTSCKVKDRFMFHPYDCNLMVDFSHSIFESIVDVRGTKFEYIPDFKDVVFKQELTLHDVEIKEGKESKHFPGNLAGRFRALKVLAQKSMNREKFLEYHAKELKYRRKASNNPFKKTLYFAYALFSNYGRSVALPMFWFVCFTLFMSIAYQSLSDKRLSFDGLYSPPALTYSIAHSFPIALARDSVSEAKNQMFGKKMKTDVETESKNEISFENWRSAILMLLNVFHSVFATILIFLIGLGLRNQFMSK